MSRYRKALVAASGLCAVLAKTLSDGQVSVAELGEVAAAAAVVYGVWRVPNA